jgi:hypothetical protein
MCEDSEALCRVFDEMKGIYHTKRKVNPVQEDMVLRQTNSENGIMGMVCLHLAGIHTEGRRGN